MNEPQVETIVISATGSVLVFWMALAFVQDTARDPLWGALARVILLSASCVFTFCLGAIRYMAGEGISLDEYYQIHGGWLIVFFISLVGLMSLGSLFSGLKTLSFF